MRPLHSGICEACRVPHIWAKDSVLDSDNTSLQKMVPVRGVFYETGEISHLVEGMEGALGISLENIIFTAHKRAIRRFFEGTLRGILGSAARVLTPRMIFKQQAKVSPNFGVGTMSIGSYSRGGPVEVYARDVWNRRLFAADVAGAFEAVEQWDCEVEIEASGELLKFTARRSEQAHEEFRGRLVPLTGVLMGTDDFPRCPGCGAPASFQVFEWNPSEGTIRERDNGLRVVHQTIACFDSMLNEIQEELGEEVGKLAARIQADFVRDMILSGAYDKQEEVVGNLEERIHRYLDLIRRRCMGNPLRIEASTSALEVVIRNAANSELLMGRALGTFEAVFGVKGSVEAVHSEGILTVTVRSSRAG